MNKYTITVMARESDFKRVLVNHPELLEQGLRFVGREVHVCGRFIDLLFEDTLHRKVVVEAKWRPIKDQDIGQIMSYEGSLISDEGPPLRTMLVGPRVPPPIQRALDYHGIAWKEIPPSDVIAFLRSKDDMELSAIFEADAPLAAVPSSSELPHKKHQMPAVGTRSEEKDAPLSYFHKINFDDEQMRIFDKLYAVHVLERHGDPSAIKRAEILQILGVKWCPNWINKNTYLRTDRNGFYRLPMEAILAWRTKQHHPD